MTDFFLPIPEPYHGRPSEWIEPPTDEIGVPVCFEMMLFHAESFALAVRHLVAYSTGFRFTLGYRCRDDAPNFHWGRHGSSIWEPVIGRLPDELFRIGVQFADGRKATSLEYFASFRPEGPAFREQRGNGGYLRWDGHYWVGPLPDTGAIELVTEWPAGGLRLTRFDLPATDIRAAALRSRD